MKTEDSSLVKNRGAGRQLARTIIDLIESERKPLNEDAHKAFWDELHGHCSKFYPPAPPEKPKPTKAEAMSDRAARAFSQETMPFGKFSDELFCDIPLKYLDWLVGENEDVFDGRLKRYLKNEKVAEQLRIELEEAE